MPQITRRGTAIVEYAEGILVNAMPKDHFLLPGGGANPGESHIAAAIRELKEETGLQAYSVLFVFNFLSRKNDHKVFWIQAAGVPKPNQEIERIGYYRDGIVTGITDRYGTQYRDLPADRMSESTQAIIEQFLEYKQRHEAILRELQAHSILVEQRYLQEQPQKFLMP